VLCFCGCCWRWNVLHMRCFYCVRPKP
jgi:hypothetical protein